MFYRYLSLVGVLLIAGACSVSDLSDEGGALANTERAQEDVGLLTAAVPTVDFDPPPTVMCPIVPECRVTGGGVDSSGGWDGSNCDGEDGNDAYTFGGQAGAPTASQPQPYGEWTHHQSKGAQGRFVFHAGTASAPDAAKITSIICSDPGFCEPARQAPAKQIDFEGVGVFKNITRWTDNLQGVVEGESLHWFTVHIEDLGEPGKGGKQEPPSDQCPPGGSAGTEANCDCPDYYTITIYGGPDSTTDVIYRVAGYIKGGNLQIHPAIQ
jgi:hypothetical protein